MKILKFDELNQWSEPTILVLGYFDGLHLGHQALFKQARDLAAVLHLKIAVLTFPEKPSLTFERYEPEMLLKLTSDEKREQLFEENGVDYLIFKELTSDFANQSAENFAQTVIQKLRSQVVIHGFDYTVGSDLTGLSEVAKNKKSALDFKLVVVGEVTSADGQKISSSRIRNLVQGGEIARANLLLGYAYETRGLVVHGFARGREIGYPTANLIIKDYLHLPAVGVYTVDVLIEGERRRGFASIGYNETFDGKEKTVEVHIFDFDRNIYGESLTVFWLDKIRDMVKFDGVAELVSQMKHDEKTARSYD